MAKRVNRFLLKNNSKMHLSTMDQLKAWFDFQSVQCFVVENGATTFLSSTMTVQSVEKEIVFKISPKRFVLKVDQGFLIEDDRITFAIEGGFVTIMGMEN